MKDTCITSQQLITIAHEHGYGISHTQLSRWHRAGMLPRPRQRASGKARGTQSLYPAYTGEQLLLLCTLRTHERRLSTLAWRLWWNGYPVDLSIIRERVRIAATWLSRTQAALISLQATAQNDDEQWVDWLEQFATCTLAYKPLRRARKRIGRADFPTFMRILTEIVTGTFEGYNTAYDAVEVMNEWRIMGRGSGCDERFLRDDENVRHYIGHVVIPLFERVSLWAKMRLWEQVEPLASDFELMQARDAIHTMNVALHENVAYSRLHSLNYPTWKIALYDVLQTDNVIEQAELLTLWLAFAKSRR